MLIKSRVSAVDVSPGLIGGAELLFAGSEERLD